MNKITCGSLFSGICDGFGLAAQWAGMEVAWQVEIEKKAHKYLQKNFPDSERFYDIRDCGEHNRAANRLAPVDIIFGGDPCQPHSVAGKRAGKKDDRYLWPEMLRIIRELRPPWVINENVAHTVHNLVLDQKITDLEAAGYATRAYIIPAVAVGAAHRRDRVWLVAYANGERLPAPAQGVSASRADEVLHRAGKRRSLFPQANRYDPVFSQQAIDAELFGETDGVPDKLFKIKGLGNALVPQIPYVFLSFIASMYEEPYSS